MDGQAELAPVSADDLAQFLIDNPDADRTDEPQENAAPTDDAPSEEDKAESETEDDDSQDDPDVNPEDADNPTSGRKFKVTVKGEDGADLEQEVDETELIAGYQRHAEFTRKTQALAQREEQAVEVERGGLEGRVLLR